MQQRESGAAISGEGCDANGRGEALVLTLDLDGEKANGSSRFDLEKAVCSHGLFMMAPNRWDGASKTLSRPLRLDSRTSVHVSIRHPHPRPSPLHIFVYGAPAKPLCSRYQHAILVQVRRMLRLSDKESRALEEFHKIHPGAAEKGLGRIFRSPTLFEDMVKCILLCNCQWSRTLSMARALCELQLELKTDMPFWDFQPRTPQKEAKKNLPKKRKRLINLCNEVISNENELLLSKQNNSSKTNQLFEQIEEEPLSVTLTGHNHEVELSGNHLVPSPCEVGNFPSPEELSKLSEELLAKRCGLGYRAKRILSLSKSVVEKKIVLEEFEELCDMSSQESYDNLTQRLLGIDGFGPFTCANVLMCMGFYHKIPSDSETIRHLKQVHSRVCTIRSIGEDLEQIYGKYAPFQFLAYWVELWEFYETRFGKTSEMSWNDYQLITATNMKVK